MDENRWLSCEVVAEREKKSLRTVQGWCYKGKLPCVKNGNSWLIDRVKYEQLRGLRMIAPDGDIKTDGYITGNLKNILVFCNYKGGVGKSTNAVITADRLGFYGNRVLLMDLDPQGSATNMAGLEPHEGVGRPARGEYKYALHDVIKGKFDELFDKEPDIKTSDAIYKSRTFHVLPCDPRSERIKYWLLDWCLRFDTVRDIHKLWTEHFPYFIKRVIDTIEQEYDYIVIDTPPEMGWATENALMAATDVVIPIELGRLEIVGLNGVLNFITNCSEKNPLLSLLGVVISRYGPHQSRLDMDIEAELRAHPVWGKYIFNTIIHRSLLIREATLKTESVFDYWRRGLSPRSIQTIEAFSDELIIKLCNSYERRLGSIS